MKAAAVSPAQIISRVLAGLVGAYAFVWGVVTLGITLLVAGGVDYGEAWTLAMLLAFVLFLTLLCWAFAARNLVRLWAFLAGGAALMSAGAWALTRQLAT